MPFAIQLNLQVADLSPGHTGILEEQVRAEVEIVRGAASLEIKARLAL
jgi:hypothetical protein